MTGRLAGKTALITAAGQGIGNASALAMAREGAKVIATDVNPKLVDALKGTPNVDARVLDVLDDAAVKRLIGELPPLDVMFNCAGYVHHGTVLDCTPKDWDFSFNLNVRAMWKTMSAALPKMLAAGGGSIINMASVCSSIKGLPNRFLYGASKAAVIGMTKSIGKDLATTGVLVNCVAPAVIATPMLDQMSQEHIDYMVSKIPMNRLGQPVEVAELIAFLASERMTFSTGATFDISGGRAVF